jgi:hypothetical protein
MSSDWRWTEGLNPHLVIGGEKDGTVISYRNVRDKKLGYHYRIPGILTLCPLFVQCDRLEKITAERANEIQDAWRAKCRDEDIRDKLAAGIARQIEEGGDGRPYN